MRPDRERRIRQAVLPDNLLKVKPFPVYTVADERMPLAIETAFYEAVNVASATGLLRSMETTLTVPPGTEESSIREMLSRIRSLLVPYPTLRWTEQIIRVSEAICAAMIQFRIDGIALSPFITSGMTVVQTGHVAHSGALQLYFNNPVPLDKRYNAAFAAAIREDASRLDIRRSRDTALAGDYPIFAAGQDGLNGLLYRLQEAGIGMILNGAALRIPVATVEICEAYGVDPMDLPAVGCTLMLTDHADRLGELLTARGIDYAVIGRTDGNSVRIETAAGIRHIAAPDGTVFYEVLRRTPFGGEMEGR
ncbi:MAG: hypothetical protein Q4P30_01265 [Eubacteriales bacterium]|nr:hypothetical protein [Eubacteriales bacterium]